MDRESLKKAWEELKAIPFPPSSIQITSLEHLEALQRQERQRVEAEAVRPYKEQLDVVVRQRDELAELVGELEVECEKFRNRARDLESRRRCEYCPPAATHEEVYPTGRYAVPGPAVRKEATVEEGFKKYVGVKLVEARPKAKTDTQGGMRHGYEVRYEDGYVSWSPREAFEKAYMEWDDPCQVSDQTLLRFVYQTDREKWSNGTQEIAGLRITSRVGTHHPKAHFFGPALAITTQDEAEEAAKYDILRELRGHLRFLAAWARNGLLGSK